MIKTKHDLAIYIELDKYALGIRKKVPSIWGDEIWKFEIALRKEEYYHYNRHSLLGKIKWKFWRGIRQRYGLLLGFDIPIYVFGPGLRINHYGYIVVNPRVKIGAFCDIHQGVNIGQDGLDENSCPMIGNNVWIGPGAKIFGKITLGDNMQIGANAVVNTNFVDGNITIGGIPATKISNNTNPFIREHELLIEIQKEN